MFPFKGKPWRDLQMSIFPHKHTYLVRTLVVYLNTLSVLLKTFCTRIMSIDKLCKIRLGICINKVNSVCFEFMLTLNILI